MSFIYAFGSSLILLGIILLLISFLFGSLQKIKLKKHQKDKYAILIPARDESRVIENLLKSIKVQNKDMSNVYVIVEDTNDPTIRITNKYGANIFVRPKPIRSRKGYALDECIKDILRQKKSYDLYFIFDADNVLDNNFISKMLVAWHKGYDVAIGYRNILNPKNLVSCCSGFMFILFNRILNKNIRMSANQPIMVSGTGFYVSGKLISKWKGFPFYTLTEDYELSTYLYSNNISSIYVEDAIYYDEQPLKLQTSIKQRTRWMKGFFEKRSSIQKDEKYNFVNKIGVLPIIILAFGVLILFIGSVVEIALDLKNGSSVSLGDVLLLSIPFLIYISFLLCSLYVFFKEKKKINLPKNKIVPCLLFMPLFLISFAICFLRSIFIKEIKWDKIEHIGNN